ncbi:MAG: putative manganese-dependent inorganic diphosphatase [Treponemataceae bacterium]
MEKTVYIFGHKNPDTDSGVAAAAYAKLKQLQGFENYKAARAGHFAPQTEYVFKKFNVPYPVYMPDLVPRVQYFMNNSNKQLPANLPVWDAIREIDGVQSKSLPVVDETGNYISLFHYSSFAQNILNIMNPERKTSISTSISLVTKTTRSQPIVISNNEDEIFKATILVGASTGKTFQKLLNEHASENVIIITSDREDIYNSCINGKVKLLIITNGFVLDKELQKKAAQNGVSVIISPHPTAPTVMLIAYSVPVSLMADTSVPAVHATDTIAKIRPILQTSPSRCLPVVDEDNKVLGLISESDLTNEPNIELCLVDHNEITQAVNGVENYKIREVIDHHRLGTLSTTYPIMFINKPVGSTATLITGLYQEARIPIPKEYASILLCGILSDTLILQSTTTTNIDRQTADYLSCITGLDIQELGKEILTAGSRLEGRSVVDLIHQDMKEYNETKSTFTISQIEVGNIDEILRNKDEFIKELEIERRSHKAIFSALLVTDITRLSSVLLMPCDPKFLPFVTFTKQDDNVYFLKDVVSRKKQLLPLITEQVENFEA